MKVENTQRHSPHNKAIKIVSIILIAVALIVISVFVTFRYVFPDLAKEVAAPIDQSLVKSGAIRKCSRSGSGFFNPDSKTPGYEAYYESSLGRKEADELMTNIANENGFNLVKAAPDRRAEILGGIADVYIDNWYFDVTSRASNYSQLTKGNIEIAVALNNEKDFNLSGIVCGVKESVTIHNDKDHTAIVVRIRLPNVR